jgi:hypothetical protein
MSFNVDLYHWNPYNQVDGYSYLANDIHNAAQDLHQISADVHGIRNAIWTNNFLGFYQIYAMRAQENRMVAHEKQKEQERRQAEMANELVAKNRLLLDSWAQLTELYKSVYSRAKELNFISEKVNEIRGANYLKRIGAYKYAERLSNEFQYVNGKTKHLGTQLSNISTNSRDLHSSYQAAMHFEENVLPEFKNLASVLALMDFKIETVINIAKTSIDFRKLSIALDEDFEDLSNEFEMLQGGKIELPFSPSRLTKVYDELRKEITDFEGVCEIAGDASYLLEGEIEEISAWLVQIDHHVRNIYQLFDLALERQRDFRRIYELNWFKK